MKSLIGSGILRKLLRFFLLGFGLVGLLHQSVDLCHTLVFSGFLLPYGRGFGEIVESVAILARFSLLLGKIKSSGIEHVGGRFVFGIQFSGVAKRVVRGLQFA